MKLIDAATAAEMAIERRLYAELRSRTTLDEPSIEALLTNAPGIVEKLRTLEALLPPEQSQVRRVAGQIAGPRNRASHAGTAPSEEEAKIAIQAAAGILTIYSPMPMPSD